LGNLQDKQYHRSCYADEVLNGWAKNATVKNLGKSTKVGKSKMVATSTIAYNKVDPKCQNVKSMAYSTSKSTFSGSGNAVVTSKIPLDE